MNIELYFPVFYFVAKLQVHRKPLPTHKYDVPSRSDLMQSISLNSLPERLNLYDSIK